MDAQCSPHTCSQYTNLQLGGCGLTTYKTYQEATTETAWFSILPVLVEFRVRIGLSLRDSGLWFYLHFNTYSPSRSINAI
ncbi:hypothetical protein I79_025473 [Cricetulus griseus]|uniref:Uncharacterized protein n=1 Tax=Cricetulus griseus TaxID=10029 RepID=G3INF2_CRIGR|nr:hypothetical protein I79_025473 [Cricetulus griseus]